MLENFEKNWSIAKNHIEERLSEEKVRLVEIIRQKEEEIAHRNEVEKETRLI